MCAFKYFGRLEHPCVLTMRRRQWNVGFLNFELSLQLSSQCVSHHPTLTGAHLPYHSSNHPSPATRGKENYPPESQACANCKGHQTQYTTARRKKMISLLEHSIDPNSDFELFLPSCTSSINCDLDSWILYNNTCVHVFSLRSPWSYFCIHYQFNVV